MSEHAKEDLKEFITYLKTVWGLISGMTFVFPLSNYFLKAIPVYGDELLHAWLASLISAFIIFLIYSIRDKINIGVGRVFFRWISIIVFIFGMTILFHYLDIIFTNIHIISEPVRYSYFDPAILLFEYSLIFGLFTTSFTLLAMSEYMMSFSVEFGR